MNKVIFCGGIGIGVFLHIAPIAHARFTRLFDAPITPKNNASECLPAVQKELRAIDVKRWGKVQFECRGGYVSNLFGSPEYFPNESSFINFSKKHWKLFDVGPISLIKAGTPWLTVIRPRLGLNFHSRELDWGKRPAAGGGHIIFFDLGTIGEPSAGMKLTPRFSKDAARLKALQSSEARGHLPNEVEGVELIIRGNCSHKGSSWVPRLAWQVRIWERPKLIYCFFDANSGEPCGSDGACSSSSDAFGP